MSQLMLTIQCEDPSRGTLEVQHIIDTTMLDTYNGPLGRLIFHNPDGPDGQFIMQASDFIIMLAQFLQEFRGTIQ